VTTVQEQIAEQIKLLTFRTAHHALRGAPDDLLVCSVLDTVLLSFIAEADIDDDARMRLSACISRAALRRLADSLEPPPPSVVSSTHRPDAVLAFRVVELWDRVGSMGFACRDPEALKEFLALMHEFREWKRIETPETPPPPPPTE